MKKILPIIYTIIFIIIDQIVKLICLQKLKPVGSIKVIQDFFYLTYVENTGAAFGVLQGARWIFVMIAFIAVVVCIVYYNRLPINKFLGLARLSLIFIVSGAIGNMIDRLFRGYVVDMFHFIFWGKDFAVFNVADILVCVGTFLLAIVIILSEEPKKDKKEKED
ncbi:signal peptidase II [uncultured Tyzzerella sp.]|uniref:signal peptidase II n=1 Tax=uncultured Tyzzerella sp. TaxID=2321398 RepID=UPI002942106C|nr:signal peptidase II [uncultured Tyzzerella sp.]